MPYHNNRLVNILKQTNMKQLTNTKMLLLSLLVAIALLAFSCSNTGRLHTGWYSAAKLKKKGYNVPNDAPKTIYIRRTNDSSKVNIVKH